MKRVVPIFIIISAVALRAIPTTSAETIRLRADSWMPDNGDPTSATPGYVVELLKSIFEPLHITVDYQNRPWADALKAANQCDIDSVIGASRIEAATMVLTRREHRGGQIRTVRPQRQPAAVPNR
jgi:hypothetical protein